MPCDWKKYPADWKERRARILERDGYCCKFCGVPNHIFIVRDSRGWHEIQPAEAEVMELDGIKTTRIVLTIAHLDRGDKDCADDRLAALCQRCHLNYDLKIHIANAAATRQRKKEAYGQLSLVGSLS